MSLDPALGVSAAAFGLSIWSAFLSRRQATAAVDQVALTRQIRREESEPYVIVDIAVQPGATGMLLLVVENVGPTLARDVRFSVDPPLQGGYDDFDSQLAEVASRTIPFMPPGRRLEWVFTMGFRVFADESLPRQYTVTVNVSGPAGPVEPLKYLIDLNAFGGAMLDHTTVEASLTKLVTNTKDISDIARELRVIANKDRSRAWMNRGRSSDDASDDPDTSAEGLLRLADMSTSLSPETNGSSSTPAAPSNPQSSERETGSQEAGEGS